jgi:hypothetical protein
VQALGCRQQSFILWNLADASLGEFLFDFAMLDFTSLSIAVLRGYLIRAEEIQKPTDALNYNRL